MYIRTITHVSMYEDLKVKKVIRKTSAILRANNSIFKVKTTNFMEHGFIEDEGSFTAYFSNSFLM